MKWDLPAAADRVILCTMLGSWRTIPQNSLKTKSEHTKLFLSKFCNIEMKKVRTVLGDVSSNDIGNVMVHEHVLLISLCSKKTRNVHLNLLSLTGGR